MLGRIVERVAALAQRGEVGSRVVARIMVETRVGEHEIGRPHLDERDPFNHADPPSATISPNSARESHQRPRPYVAQPPPSAP